MELSDLPTQAKPLTEAGAILGTFQYMAPEQLEGLDVDARTDLFDFGAVVCSSLPVFVATDKHFYPEDQSAGGLD